MRGPPRYVAVNPRIQLRLQNGKVRTAAPPPEVEGPSGCLPGMR
jgi:hypothetical protein